jgi:hypothetical protein
VPPHVGRDRRQMGSERVVYIFYMRGPI